MLLSAHRNIRASPQSCRDGGDSCLSLGRVGKAHPVAGHVVDRVIFLEEDISQNPQGLPIGGGQVSGLNSKPAVAIVLKRQRT